MLVCYCGESVISGRVTLSNLVREMTDVETVDDVERKRGGPDRRLSGCMMTALQSPSRRYL